MTIDQEPIKHFMLRAPATVGPHHTLKTALHRMHDQGVRDLVVMSAGVVRGIISVRDIGLAYVASPDNAKHVTVAQVMSAVPVQLSPGTSLHDAVGEMAEHGHGAAVVMDGGRPVGLLHEGTALAVLSGQTPAKTARDLPKPSEVRQRIQDAHTVIRGLLVEVETLADGVLAGDRGALPALEDQAHGLFIVLCEHLELEDTILAPALRESDAFGPVRAEKLLSHHREQRIELAQALQRFDDQPADDERFAQSVKDLIADLREDMQHEESELLTSDLLADSPIHVLFTG